MVLANSINQPGIKGNMIVRCINPTNQLLELAASLTIGAFTSIDQQDIKENKGIQPGSERRIPTTSKVPDHLEAMLQKACQNGVTKELLNRYQAVFSQNDQDVRKNDLVQHRIPV